MRIIGLALALVAAGCDTPPSDACMPACAEGYLCIEGACVAGAGDMAMGGGDGSVAACDPACGGLTPYCNASHHCVGCLMDAQCPNGKFCDVRSDTMAVCAIGCNGDDRCGGGKCCDKTCVDTATDPDNCGDCAHACGAPHAKATCVNGVCGAGACDFGWGDCDGDAGNGCEINLHVDEKNCTACGQACSYPHGTGRCADGCYISACDFGYDDCNGNEMDGCETSVLADANNCGGCGVPCTGLPNAMANCTAGNCVLGACLPGFANCNGDPNDGCEVNLMADGKNCNGCGNVCPMQTPNCSSGKCGTLFTFNGVQNNLDVNQLGGWTLCYKDTYANGNTSLQTILNMCPGSNLLLACRKTNTNTLLLAAEAPRADVIFMTQGGNCNGGQVVHQANGVGWYYNTAWSWGFVKGGDTADLCSCDTSNVDPNQRMCWHTGGGNINGGYRCGTAVGLGDGSYERLVFSSN